MKFLYDTVLGRLLLKIILQTRVLKFAANWLRTPFSRILIKPYIKKHRIDTRGLYKNKYDSFAEFFSRKRKTHLPPTDPEDLISPCDGLLSVYPIQKNKRLHIKNSWYSIHDLITDEDCADCFEGGLCMIFRLRESDYHRFCYLDDCYHNKGHFVQGTLHSVQPIACEKEPVYRLNRRMWSILDTAHFGQVAQIEVGALLVGGIVHEKENVPAKKGEEMGRFELAGSTIILLFQKQVRARIKFNDSLWGGLNLADEIPVKMGQVIAKRMKD